MKWIVSAARAKFLAAQTMMVSANLLTWITIHGNVCLALRHPQNKGPSRTYAVEFVKQLGRALVKSGAITEEELREAERIEIEEGTTDLKT